LLDMRFTPTAIKDVLVIEPKVFEDHRGFFMETYRRDAFAAQGINADFVQINHSQSVRNTLRGLHYQVGHPQGEKWIIWNDPDLDIPWPTPEPLLSEKDRYNPLFRDIARDFSYNH